MGDSFNPHEILSRLRSKPVGINNTNAQTIVNSGYGNNVPNGLNSNGSLSSNGITSPAKSISSSKNIKQPAALTLTPAQRQDNLAMRSELEKEVKRLQDEVAALKSENRQLKADKEDVERQFIEFKVKHDNIVTKLRGKIAEVALSRPTPHDGTGKIYPPGPILSPQTKPNSAIKIIPTMTGYTSPMVMGQPQFQPPPPPPPQQPVPLPGEAEGFREPTFSELMRRSSVEPPEFKDSLRKGLHSNNGKESKSKNTNKSNQQQSQHPHDDYLNQLAYDSTQQLQQPALTQQSLQQQQQQARSNPMANQQSPNAPQQPPPPPSQPNPSTTHRTLNRTSTFFDANFMKTNYAAAMNNLNGNENSTPNYPEGVGGSYRPQQGSMYSIHNNYPGFGNSNLDYDSPAESTGNNNRGGGGSRKMSLPSETYLDLSNSAGGEVPVVELDLS